MSISLKNPMIWFGLLNTCPSEFLDTYLTADANSDNELKNRKYTKKNDRYRMIDNGRYNRIKNNESKLITE